MRLSIITINLNNASGLDKTIRSVASQTFKDFEYIVIDGASSDNSVKVIKSHEGDFAHLKWVSEPDKGIYNAMNKGIRMASGDYVQILNSADCLASENVTERMLAALDNEGAPSILYGNMVKCFPDGHRMVDRCFAGEEITMLGFYTGTLNHDPAYIRRSLFEKFGYYDEELKIVSDWKWYLQAIVFGGERPRYVDMEVTLFDMMGVSETNVDLCKVERKLVLNQLIPRAILMDYERFAFPMEQIMRLKRFPLVYKLIWLLERCLFKYEKWTIKSRRYYYGTEN